MAKESILRIAEAEKAAQEEEARAKMACDEIVRNAEGEAKRIAEEASEKARRIIDAHVEKAKSAAMTIEKDSANDAKREAAALAKSAENGHDRAVSMVIETLVSQDPA